MVAKAKRGRANATTAPADKKVKVEDAPVGASGTLADKEPKMKMENSGMRDNALFEELCLGGAAAGMSFSLIGGKRDAYRRAFHNFDIEKCASMTAADVNRLLVDDGKKGAEAIVRNKAKVNAIVKNAQNMLALKQERAALAGKTDPDHGFLEAFLREFVNGKPKLSDAECSCPYEVESMTAVSDALKKRGFAFVGPVSCAPMMRSL